MVDRTAPELIEVRPDERFDHDAVSSWIGGRLPGSDGGLEVRQFGRGKANLTYLLRYPDHEYVLRRPPIGPVAPSSHDMAREYRVLSTLWQAFPKAARALLFCADPDIIGAPFFIMERRQGVVVQDRIPAVFGGGTDTEANRRLSAVVVDTLAEFHEVDPQEAGLADLGRPEGFVERQLAGWLERWNRAAHEDNPVADDVARWLQASLPTTEDVTLVHNDWRLDNMAVDEHDPGRCVAVYDWDMCTRGDPLADVGTLMAVWHDPGEMAAGLSPMPTTAPGFLSRAEAIERYGEVSGRDLSHIDWYVVFGTFKMAAVIQQIYVRWLRGQTSDARFAVMGDGARQLIDLASARRP